MMDLHFFCVQTELIIMKRILILLLTVAFVAVVVHSQTVNFSSVKVKTKTEKEKRVYEFPYEQFVMIDYDRVFLSTSHFYGNSLGIRYGQVHIGGWYVNADISLSPLHFSYSGVTNGYHKEGRDDFMLDVSGKNVCSRKLSFNRVSLGGGGIVRIVIPLYFYLGLGYMYQNVTAETEELGRIELRPFSPHSSVYGEFGLQGNIKGFTMRLGFRSNFVDQNELSVGIGWTFARKSKKNIDI